MKKYLSIILALLMLISIVPMGTFAAETNVAFIGETGFTTLGQAISAAKSGDVITLSSDVTENVTIEKSITLDGAGNDYTGKISLNKASVTIQNVDFIKGCVEKAKKTTNGCNYTFRNCNFDGQGLNNYALNLNLTGNILIEDCSFSNYGYGALQVPTSNVSTTIKNVKVSNVNYGFKIDYSSGVTLENVTMSDIAYYGIYNSNYGEKTYTIRNCNFDTEFPIRIWQRNNTTYTNFVFEGENTFSSGEIISGSDLVNVKGVVYTVAIGEKKFSSLKAAVAAAKDGDVITVLADQKLADSDAEIAAYDMYAYITVADKKVTIDLNGKTVTVNPELDKNMLAVFFADGTGDLTLTDSSEAQTGSVEVTMGENTQAYSMFTADGDYSKLTIESGNYTIDKVEAGYSMFYAATTGTGYVSGGNFVLGNANQMLRDGVPAPWIFNTYRNAVNFIEVTGGTYNVDPTHRWNEARFPDGYKVVENEDGTYSVIMIPVAAIGDDVYFSLKEAVAAAKDGDVITVLADQKLADSDAEIAAYDMYAYITVADKKVTIDLNGKTVTVNPELDKNMLAVFFADGTGDLTLTDSSEAQTGSVEVTMGENTQAYSMFTADGDYSKLTIESGNYTIDKVEAGYSMFYAATTGTGYVSGGNFVLGNANQMLRDGVPAPWIFNTYLNAKNFIEVTGGTYNVDPTHRWNEANFPKCYKVIENEDGTYSVVYAPIAAIGDDVYASIKEAVAAAKDGDVITVLADHELENGDAEIVDYDMCAYFAVSDKKITIDLNGKTITATPDFDKEFYGVVVVNGTGDLTLTDSSKDMTGAIRVTAADDTVVYSMISTDGETSKLTIDGGNYEINRVDKGYAMIYVAQTGTGYVNGGNFVLGNAKTVLRQGVMAPWIFNCFGNGKNVVYVNGGTYNTDPTHHWNEVKFPKGYVAAPDEDGTWSIVRGPVVIEQPADITIGYGKMAKFAPEIRGEGLTYKWYYKDANDLFYHTSTLKTATYDIKGLVERDGRQIYCVATDAYGKKVTTETVTLTVVPNAELKIVSQPTAVEGALDKKVSVALNVQGDDLTYKWYFRDKGAKNFQKSSLTSATYDIVLTKARMGREVYCVITDAFGTQVTSEVITINAVKSVELKVSALSYDSVAVGETVTVKMDAEGEYLTYAWYFCDGNGNKFTKSSIKDSEYSITLTKARVGRQVYCVVTDAFGDSVTTEPIVIK